MSKKYEWTDKYLFCVKASSGRIIKGKVYRVHTVYNTFIAHNRPSILDEHGKGLQPTNNKHYWRKATNEELFDCISSFSKAEAMTDVKHGGTNVNHYLSPQLESTLPDEGGATATMWEGTITNLTINGESFPMNEMNEIKEATKMLTIKNVTLINGEDSKKFTIETLIGLIQKEEKLLDEMKKVQTKSKAVAKRIEQHNTNINDLVVILDAKEG